MAFPSQYGGKSTCHIEHVKNALWKGNRNTETANCGMIYDQGCKDDSTYNNTQVNHSSLI